MMVAELSVEPVKPKLTLFNLAVENVTLRIPLASLLSVWARSPKKLQKQVAEILIDECGMPELVPAEFGGTKDA